MRTLKHPARDLPDTVKGNLVVTSVRVEESPGHDLVHVWNRGGKSGVLTVNKGDGLEFARRLLDNNFIVEADEAS